MRKSHLAKLYGVRVDRKVSTHNNLGDCSIVRRNVRVHCHCAMWVTRCLSHVLVLPGSLVHLAPDCPSTLLVSRSLSAQLSIGSPTCAVVHRGRILVTVQVGFDKSKSVDTVQHHLNHILMSRHLSPCHQAHAGFVHILRWNHDHHFRS